MYYHIPPSALYQEYQTRVENALRNMRHAVDVQSAAQPRQPIWQQFRTWLDAERERLIRALQPAEEGYIA